MNKLLLAEGVRYRHITSYTRSVPENGSVLRRKPLLPNGKRTVCFALFELCIATANLNVEAVRSSCYNKS